VWPLPDGCRPSLSGPAQGQDQRGALLRGCVEALTLIRIKRKIEGTYRINDMRWVEHTGPEGSADPICITGENGERLILRLAVKEKDKAFKMLVFSVD
jgi:hypothetical protein